MKITKKVLSIVLAVAMLVSMGIVAFARTSAEVLDGTETLTWTLKAQVMSSDMLSKDSTTGEPNGVLVTEQLNGEARDTYLSSAPATSYLKIQNTDVKTYKSNVSNLTYHTGTTPIEVKPGDMIWITTHIKSSDNLYPVSTVQTWLYDSNMFRTLVGTIGQVMYKNSSSTMLTCAKDEVLGTTWARMPLTNRQGLYDSFTELTTAEKELYHFQNATIAFNANYMNDELFGETVPVDEDIYAIPVYVSSEAQPGQTGKIFMSPATSKAVACEDSEGDYLDDCFTIPASGHDLTNTVLNFVVVGDSVEVNYDALNAAISDYEGRTAANYTDATWQAATTAYNAAVAARESTDQTEVDTAAEALEEALAALKEKVVLNYANWEAAVAGLPSSVANYTTSSVAAYNAAKAQAEADKEAAVTAESQANLDAAATALTAAKSLLVAKASFTDINATIADAKAVQRDKYTADSLQVLDNALAAAEAFDQDDTPASAQADVDDADDTLYDAIQNLEEIPVFVADLKNWNAAVAKIPASLAGYTTSSVAAYNTAKTAAYTAKDAAVSAENQAGIDAAAEDLEAAIALLKEKIDVSTLQAKIEEIDAKNYNADFYPTEAYENLQNALGEGDEIVANADDLDDQSIVTEAIAAIEAADAAMIMLDADYTVVNNAKATIPSDLSSYTDASVAALESAVDAVQTGLKKDQQAVVNGYATAITNAVSALKKKPADKDALKATINSVANYNEADYTVDTWADVETALANAISVRDNNALTIDDQATVTAANQALVNALAALEAIPVGANKNELQKKVNEANAVTRYLYTEDSLAKLDAALEAALEVLNNDELTEDDQAIVENALAALDEAIKGLERKPAEGMVTDVQFTDTPYSTNTFTITVTGRPNKVRFTSVNNSTLTATYNRTDARAYGTIVSYNAAGEVVGDLAPEVAYEVWTITNTLSPDGYYVSAKNNDGWEPSSLAYQIDFKYSTDNAAVNTVEVPATATAGDTLPVVVTTGADVIKVRTLYNGTVFGTFNNGVDNGDGTKTFDAFVKVYHAGEQTVSVEIKTANGWEAVEGFDKVVTVTK